MTQDITYDVDSERTATIWIDQAGKRVNTLTRAILTQMGEALTSIENHGGVRGLIFASRKPTTFAAGADLNELLSCTPAGLDQLLREGQAFCTRVERLPWPTVAAINGHCLGGGLELALSCRYRVATNDPRTLIGLPEVSLGMLPAWGGTVRLCRLIGVKKAAPLLLTGRKMFPSDALHLRIIDHLTRPDDLLAAARDCFDSPPTRHSLASTRMRDRSPLVRHVTLHRARQHALRENPELASAIDRIIKAIDASYTRSTSAGFDHERQSLVKLLNTSETRLRLQSFLHRTPPPQQSEP